MSDMQIQSTHPKLYVVNQYYLKHAATLQVNQGTPPFSNKMTAEQITIKSRCLFQRAIVTFSKTVTQKPPKEIRETAGFHDYLIGCRRLLFPTDFSAKSSSGQTSPIGLFQASAHQNFAPALFLFSYLHLHGIEVQQDQQLAIRLALQAADLDFAPAQHYVAYQYLSGNGGFAKNHSEASKWFQKSEQNGLPRSDSEISYFNGLVRVNNQDTIPSSASPLATRMPITLHLNVSNEFKHYKPKTIKPNRPQVTPTNPKPTVLTTSEVARLNAIIANLEAKHREEVNYLREHIAELEEAIKGKEIDAKIMQWLYESAHPEEQPAITPPQEVITPIAQAPEAIPTPSVALDIPQSEQKEQPQSTKKRFGENGLILTTKRQRIPKRLD